MSVHYRDMIRHLEKHGFKIVSQKGSHRKFSGIKGDTIIVPVHPNRSVLSKYTYNSINKQLFESGYTKEKYSI